jgi:hypothetical protein
MPAHTHCAGEGEFTGAVPYRAECVIGGENMELCGIRKILRMNIDMGDGRTVIITPQSGIIQFTGASGTRFFSANDIKAITLEDKIHILLECEEADTKSLEVE